MGLPTVGAGIALLLGAGLLIWFFVTENRMADRASNWLFGAFYVLMAWGVVDVHRFYADPAPAIWFMTVVVLAALAVSFAATVLVLLGVVGFQRVAAMTTGAWLLLMLWMLGVSILVLAEGGLPVGLGWLGIVVMSVSVVTVGLMATDRDLLTGAKTPPPALNAAFAVILGGLTVWIVWLGAASTTAI